MRQQMTVEREHEFCYEIVWDDTFSGLQEAVSSLYDSGRKACIVTDTCIAPLYLEKVRSSLQPVFAQVTDFVLKQEKKTRRWIR